MCFSLVGSVIKLNHYHLKKDSTQFRFAQFDWAIPSKHSLTSGQNKFYSKSKPVVSIHILDSAAERLNGQFHLSHRHC